MTTLSCDLAIVGGGPAGGLIALALAEARPALDMRLIESGPRIGGNAILPLFADDLAAHDRAIVEPLICCRWPAHRVRFPAGERRIETDCRAMNPARLDAAVRARLGDKAMTGCKALAANAHAVVLADGRRIEAAGVIDARGPGDLSLLDLGRGRFAARELELAAPHGEDVPVITDATAAQATGGRFIRTLPLSPTRILIGESCYDDAPAHDPDAIRSRFDAYAAARGWRVTRIVREETGMLPVVTGGDFEAYWQSGGHHVAKVGLRAALFHPTTGNALPDAVRTAALIARQHDFSGAALHDLFHDLARRAWDARRFYRLLARMLLHAAAPDRRDRAIAHFYGLDPALIGRFYAGRSTMGDKMRILAGRPPVPIARALSAAIGRPA